MATMQNIIDEARVILQDSAKVRYTDADLLLYANLALYEARKARPDLFFASIGTASSALVVGATFPLEPQYESSVANFVVSRAEMRDDEYSQDGRAAALLGLFKGALMGAV